MKHYNNMTRQAGMTLIELTVVLLVLIGLAGLMIPYVGGFVDKTHNSVNADSLGAVNGAIQRYDVQFMGYPDGMDSLLDSADNTQVYGKMMNSALYTALQLSTAQSRTLSNVGIGSVYDMWETTTNATFQANTGAERALGGGQYVARITNKMNGMALDDDNCKLLFNGKNCDTTNNYYVAFGVGTNNSMIGRTISEAPVHFAKNAGMAAQERYNRILAVFQVPINPDGGMMTTEKAKFMGTVMPMSMLMGLGEDLSAEYAQMAAQ